ncbi:HTH-type transcriptional regulator, LysR familiy [Gottschalkia acidurici 9a]|uniref:HTH-type transcriptional regulator, LysR familiy n=1 Tax=Gottschalkia acidurici (strain ATCC 7906 / DSM 604 / BCRC 14475 / CIP 104303 / KCTC 5404 / NCIMB 10678 / 9a) TaxID=1128398 RepID=K0AXL1_GOTA9|nr:LysR family transcriptional regulator [Gottschalkia acidurici]AFS77176.1 HTH-type transcriptional regulator, LysR familiy [Gottschalkia acidurici 9a]
MKVKTKIWLEEKDQIIFGQGPRELLVRTKEYGSLSKAASSMRMSYSKAWNLIDRIEDVLGYKLLEKKQVVLQEEARPLQKKVKSL